MSRRIAPEIRATPRGEALEDCGGHSIMQAEPHDAAMKLFGPDHPHMMMPGGWIEVTEIMPARGM